MLLTIYYAPLTLFVAKCCQNVLFDHYYAGHANHGKTSILDALFANEVKRADHEAGDITQRLVPLNRMVIAAIFVGNGVVLSDGEVPLNSIILQLCFCSLPALFKHCSFYILSHAG